MNWIDITIVIIILYSAIEGMVKGFISTVFNLVGYLLAAVIAKIYYPVVAKFIMENTDFSFLINSKIAIIVNDIINSIYNPESVHSILEKLKLPRVLQEGIVNNPEINGNLDALKYTTGNYIASALTEVFVNIISIVIVFALARIVLIIIFRMLNNIAKLPVLHTFNRASGFLLGLLKGIIIVFIVYTIVTPAIMIYPDGFIAQETYCSVLGKFFYTNNLIIAFIKERGVIKI